MQAIQYISHSLSTLESYRRNFDCIYYDDCLMVAARKDAISFVCDGCDKHANILPIKNDATPEIVIMCTRCGREPRDRPTGYLCASCRKQGKPSHHKNKLSDKNKVRITAMFIAEKGRHGCMTMISRILKVKRSTVSMYLNGLGYNTKVGISEDCQLKRLEG
jgi:hypothetical protein